MQDFSWESIWASMEKEKVMLEARINVNRKVLFDILKKNNVERVFVYFDGSGDSGEINNVEITPETADPLLEETAIGFVWPDWNGASMIKESDITIVDAIETICYDYLRFKHPGWETNEGASGHFDIKVDSEKIFLEFQERSISTYSDEF